MLLRGVREVAALVNPDEPEAVTQRAFDAARANSAPHASLPRARQVTERLNLPWAEVLELAQLPVQTQQRRLGKKDGEEEQDWVSAEHVGAVLGIVAARLGVSTLTQVQYTSERERMLAENKRRKPALLLPTEAQIRFAMRREIHGDPHRATPTKGTWDRALELAGLEINQKPPRKVVAGPGYNKWANPGECVAVLVEYVEQLPPGQRANARHYRVWARGQARAPHEMTLRRHGGWSKLLALAHEEVVRRRISAATQS
jgi:hypothetical protein